MRVTNFGDWSPPGLVEDLTSLIIRDTIQVPVLDLVPRPPRSGASSNEVRYHSESLSVPIGRFRLVDARRASPSDARVHYSFSVVWTLDTDGCDRSKHFAIE
jgi:hypothetical protein